MQAVARLVVVTVLGNIKVPLRIPSRKDIHEPPVAPRESCRLRNEMNGMNTTIRTHLPSLYVIVLRQLGKREEAGQKENCPRKNEWHRNAHCKCAQR